MVGNNASYHKWGADNASANPNPDQGMREPSGMGSAERVLDNVCVGRPHIGVCDTYFDKNTSWTN